MAPLPRRRRPRRLLPQPHRRRLPRQRPPPPPPPAPPALLVTRCPLLAATASRPLPAPPPPRRRAPLVPSPSLLKRDILQFRLRLCHGHFLDFCSPSFCDMYCIFVQIFCFIVFIPVTFHAPKR